jgi:flotillin
MRRQIATGSSIPSWGRVVAAPHEFLIQLRGGVVKASGQGASCFKWPSDSVALVPMSIEKIAFTADQVTKEKVGVEVTGLAVYRIVEPLIAYRMIDGDMARLAEILRDMFVGATRRIVANLSLEECMTHRKELVAHALVAEIAPVLAGEGSPDDATHKGWGVVLDTIEIQNVRVLSEEVFRRLQAPYREELALAALRAREHVEEEQARIGLARKRTEEAARRELMQLEEDRRARERAREAETLSHESELATMALDADIARKRRDMDATRDRAFAEMEIRRAQGELETTLARAAQEARGELSDRQLEELLLTTTMPRVAEAFRGSFDRIELTQSSGDSADLFAFLSAGVREVTRATERFKRQIG